MFANNKNPLAADLIKEFKTVANKTSVKSELSCNQSEGIESPSRILLSRLRSTESNDEGLKTHVLKRTTTSSTTLPRGVYVSNRQTNKKLDHILAIKAKSKPVPLPVPKTLKQTRTKSVDDLLQYDYQNRTSECSVGYSVSLDSWDSDEDISDKYAHEDQESYYEEPNLVNSFDSGCISPVSSGYKPQLGYSPSVYTISSEGSGSGSGNIH